VDNANSIEATGLTANAMQTNKSKPKKAGDLGKDEFLKLLITQLSHQDPLKPMEDKEFIAQMAQFSALEQMMQINNNINKLNKTDNLNRAFFFLGKNVKVLDKITKKIISGKVEEIDLSNNGMPRLRIKNQLISVDEVIGIVTSEESDLTSDKLKKK